MTRTRHLLPALALLAGCERAAPHSMEEAIQGSLTSIAVATLLGAVGLVAGLTALARRQCVEYVFCAALALSLCAFLSLAMPLRSVFLADLPLWDWLRNGALALAVITFGLTAYQTFRTSGHPREKRWVGAGCLILCTTLLLELLLPEARGRALFFPWGLAAVVLSFAAIFVARLITLYRANARTKRQLEQILAGTREMGTARDKISAAAKAVACVAAELSFGASGQVDLFLAQGEGESQVFCDICLTRAGIPLKSPEPRQCTSATSPVLATALGAREAFVSAEHGLVVPILWGSRHLGALRFSECRGPALSYEENHFVNTLANELALTLSNLDFLSDSLAKAALERELATAALVQEALLPRAAALPGVSLATSYRSAEQTGGDWYGYFHDQERNCIDFFIGDVTGHGVPAALMTGVLFGSIYGNSHSLRHTPDPEARLRALAEITNRVLHDAGNGRMFATMILATLDLSTGDFHFLNAGHNPPFLVRSDHTVQPLLAMGKRLGYDPQASFKVKKATLQPGDSVFLYTDGLLENTDRSGAIAFDEKRLRAFLGEAALAHGFGYHDQVVNTARSAWKDHPPADDVTTLAFLWHGRPMSQKTDSWTEQ